jgi:mRNA interferase RelE/StbE
MTYRVDLSDRAARALGKLPRDVAVRLDQHLRSLRDDPRPLGVRQLHGHRRGVLRLRVGAYRILYTIDDTARVVDVVGIGHRSRIYG